MNITDIQIRLHHNSNRLKGIACIVIEGIYALNDILIIQTENRLCVEFPKNRKGYQTFVPLTVNARAKIEAHIIKEYNIKMKEGK